MKIQDMLRKRASQINIHPFHSPKAIEEMIAAFPILLEAVAQIHDRLDDWCESRSDSDSES